jgi:hypothetical protein
MIRLRSVRDNLGKRRADFGRGSRERKLGRGAGRNGKADGLFKDSRAKSARGKFGADGYMPSTFPLKDMLGILSESREPEIRFELRSSLDLLHTSLCHRKYIFLARIAGGRLAGIYRLVNFRKEILFYQDEKGKAVYAISFSRLIREQWFIWIKRNWTFIC